LVQVKDEKKENKDIQEASTLAIFNLEMEIPEGRDHDCSGPVQDLLSHGTLHHQLTQASSSLHHSSTISPTSRCPLPLHPTTFQTLCILFNIGFNVTQPDSFTF
jgi:hypothetical protein